MDVGNIGANRVAAQNNARAYTTTKPTSSVGQSSLSSGYVAGNDFFGEETLGPLGTRNGENFTPRSGGTILEFPMNVASGDAALGNHGHYIMFYIN